LHHRCHSDHFGALGREHDLSICAAGRPDGSVVAFPIKTPSRHVFVVLQDSILQAVYLTGSREQEVLWRRNSHGPNLFCDEAQAQRIWVQRPAGLCTRWVREGSATIRMRGFSVFFVPLFIPSQQSLWPDCVAESELLPMAT